MKTSTHLFDETSPVYLSYRQWRRSSHSILFCIRVCNSTKENPMCYVVHTHSGTNSEKQRTGVFFLLSPDTRQSNFYLFKPEPTWVDKCLLYIQIGILQYITFDSKLRTAQGLKRGFIVLSFLYKMQKPIRTVVDLGNSTHTHRTEEIKYITA